MSQSGRKADRAQQPRLYQLLAHRRQQHGKDAKEVGGFGEVQVVSHRKTGTRYAMKTVKLSSVKSEKAFDFIMKEVDLLKTLDHPNIVRLQVCACFFYRTSIE
ncbi:calmodulin-domain protein kinase [Ectocarpus siliculosus]|uniref:Calmodulin-domain protein kinase n=1 Tax=Ectocarpus siliculosus TaxID=2880 RepID=D7G9I7_ECTSI|nr:calmodulin-domain protein kinase [Ectocarpus siliculosus]|eukprot:CBJ34097.1 calmodulin-domain protein kinase [Ectocarpus siliculosus]